MLAPRADEHLATCSPRVFSLLGMLSQGLPALDPALLYASTPSRGLFFDFLPIVAERPFMCGGHKKSLAGRGFYKGRE